MQKQHDGGVGREPHFSMSARLTLYDFVVVICRDGHGYHSRKMMKNENGDRFTGDRFACCGFTASGFTIYHGLSLYGLSLYGLSLYGLSLCRLSIIVELRSIASRSFNVIHGLSIHGLSLLLFNTI